MITFGICVGSDYIDFDSENLRKIIASINNTAGYNTHEILLIGNRQYCRYSYGQVFCEPINCFTRNAWITCKKNSITDLALFDIIVYSHDYFIYHEDFYENVICSDPFDIAVPRILNPDGSRWRDKISWGNPAYPPAWIQHEPWTGTGMYHEGQPRMEPYDREIPRDYWFVNGSFWIARKSTMRKYPLNERLIWGEAEDCEWSFRFRKDKSINLKYIDTEVYLLKQKDNVFLYAN